MPFKSKAQQRYMYSQHPSVAAKWEDKTPNMKGLPDHVKPRGKRKPPRKPK